MKRAMACGVLLAIALSGCSGNPSPAPPSDSRFFDLQSHRGGRGDWAEESLTAFAKSLELGVTTLELDTHLTDDGKVIVWHDRVIQASKCQDTAPATPGDVEFPYVGDPVAELSLAQIKTLICSPAEVPGQANQNISDGSRIVELKDVYRLVRDYDAAEVRFNVEIKVQRGRDGDDGALTKAVVDEINRAGVAERTTVQSFSWSSLNLVQAIAPELPLVALSQGAEWLGVGMPGANPELGGVDIDDYDGSLAKAAAAQGYDAISPAVESVTPEMIAEAHEHKLPVIPWTVNSTEEMERLIDLGVDGMVTDNPARLRSLMEDLGLKLPKAYKRKT